MIFYKDSGQCELEGTCGGCGCFGGTGVEEQLGVVSADLSGEVTVFVTTVGDEANFRECISHLRAQTVRFRLDVIEGVAPLSAAFQQMHVKCATPYYVQVDEDMMLAPDAVRKLHARISAAPPDIALVAYPLWDCEVHHAIYGLKIYRHQVVRQFPYRDVFSCEREQLHRLEAAGYQGDFIPLGGRETCLGEHGKHYTPEKIFKRWRRLMQKRRRFGHQAARGVPDFGFLVARYRETGDPLHLFAMLGAAAGLTGDLMPERESDYRERDSDFDRLSTQMERMQSFAASNGRG